LVLFLNKSPSGVETDFASKDDAIFQAMVEEKMPGYVLTSEMMGTEFIPSDAYAFQVFQSSLSAEGKIAVLERFLSRHEEQGLEPFRLYFLAGSLTPRSSKVWRIDFEGCWPNACAEKAQQVKYTEVSRGEYEIYGPRFSRQRRFVFLRETINGISYKAYLSVYSDAIGRVYKYSVSSYRSPKNQREKTRLETRFSFAKDFGVPTFRYVRNVVLNRETKSTRPPIVISDGINRLAGF